ncbi:MAG: hypothetical protein C6I00_01525 [Nitratiruptor sp.]|nr:hypothetical protein [Nitratiruptor sp.]NPA83278.1 DUF4149 domain-containing protein [Campylobacterota bacterium]
MARWIDTLYLALLGMALGAIVTLAFIVAPVVFESQRYGMALDHYQMGRIMSAIFQQAVPFFHLVAVAIILREGYDYKRFRRDWLLVPAAATALLTIFLFTLYYTPKIIGYQGAGASVVHDPRFQNLHKGSEIDFALAALSLALLLGRRLYLQCKG